MTTPTQRADALARWADEVDANDLVEAKTAALRTIAESLERRDDVDTALLDAVRDAPKPIVVVRNRSDVGCLQASCPAQVRLSVLIGATAVIVQFVAAPARYLLFVSVLAVSAGVFFFQSDDLQGVGLLVLVAVAALVSRTPSHNCVVGRPRRRARRSDVGHRLNVRQKLFICRPWRIRLGCTAKGLISSDEGSGVDGQHWTGVDTVQTSRPGNGVGVMSNWRGSSCIRERWTTWNCFVWQIDSEVQMISPSGTT